MNTISSAPDLIVHNGKVVTVDAAFTIADGFAVRGERILSVGDGAGLLDAADARTEILDLGGRTVVPGFFDGHAHMDREGLTEIYPSLKDAHCIDDILQIVEALVADSCPGEWIVTMPLGAPPNYLGTASDLTDGRFPDRHDLDKVSPDNPVYIRPVWGYWRHDMAEPLVSVANSKALELAGIGRGTPEHCSTVVFDKDSAGDPTGIFFEDTLQPIIELTFMRGMRRFSAGERARGLKRSMEVYQSFATTSVFEGHGLAAEIIEAYKQLSADGTLTMRADIPLSPSWDTVAGVDPGALFDTWAGWLAGHGLGDSHLRVAGLFVLAAAPEGSVLNREDQLRAEISPYTGWASRYYDHALARQQLIEVMVAAARRDIRIATITPPMLGVLAEVNEIEPIRDKRWVLGHIGILSPEQVHRIRDLGLATTTHTNRSIYSIGSKLRDGMEPERESDIMPLRRMLDAGAHFALATDNLPVSLFHPYWQTVSRIDRVTGERIAEDQKLSREEALRALTMGGAYLCMSEADRGSLEVGKLADFAVLSADPLSVAEDDLKDIQSERTVIGGQTVYERGRNTESGG
ncbi:MAG: amidohydrolase family protein [Rhodospirillales bacterium]